MKPFSWLLILFIFLTFGCTHQPFLVSSGSPSVASPLDQAAISRSEDNQLNAPGNSAEDTQEGYAGRNDRKSAGMEATKAEENMPSPPESREAMETSVAAQDEKADTGAYGDYVDEGEKEKKVGIADPLEPFNRAMYHFNDKLYFWVIKPVAQGYRKVVPEAARVGVSNFFTNLASPIRFVNCLLQANFSGAASELGRFVVNTLWGIVGLFDPASNPDINLAKCDEDFGQTLGAYGLGQGFYINWPIFGPSSLRDTVGMVGDFFLHPLSYLHPWEASAGTKAYDKVNDTSLKIGDYESLKEAAIDPYVAIRDAYVQYRMNKVKARGQIQAPSQPESENTQSEINEALPP